jgi:hypothetical protein
MPQTKPQTTTAQPQLPQEKVASRAYQKWLQGGCQHGCDQKHWYEAEQEIRAELARTGTPAAGQKR